MPFAGRQFWKTVSELALRGAGLGIALAVGNAAFNAWDADWERISGFAVGGAVVSIAMSIGLTKVGQKDSPLVTAKPALSGHGWNPVDPPGDD